MNYEERKNAWNQNKTELRKWIAESGSSFEALEPIIQERLRKIIGRAGATKSTGSINDKIRERFIEKTTLTSFDIFKEFKIGDVGMKAFIKSQLSRKDASTWIWIEYHEDEDAYELIGQGQEIPDDYSGWIPTEMRDI